MEKRWLNFFLVVFLGYFALMYYYASTAPPKPPQSERTESQAQAEVIDLTDDNSDSVNSTTAERSINTIDVIAENGDSGSAVDSALPTGGAELLRMTRKDVEPIVINTPLIHLEFSPVGGVPVKWEILPSDYLAPVTDAKTGKVQTIDLIPQVQNPERRFVPLELEGKHLEVFNEVLHEYTLEENANEITVIFTSPVVDELQVTRTYVIQKDSFISTLNVSITAQNSRIKIGYPNEGFGLGWQGGFLQPYAESLLGGYIYAAASVGDDVRLKSVDLGDDPVIYENKVAWAGQEKKYFAGIIIPSPENPAKSVQISSRRRDKTAEYEERGVQDPMSVVLYQEDRTLDAGETVNIGYSLFVGPKDYHLLKNLQVSMLATGQPLSELSMAKMPLNFTWVRPISILLLESLRKFESFLKNWGLAIIMLVLTVKILLYPLSHWAIVNQAKTMAEQTRVRPLLEEINKKYKNDSQKRTQETMALYREHNINPLGALRGCFPLLIQMPIFFGLYVALDQSIEIRGQSFMWIADLAAPDQLFQLGFTIPLLGWSAFNLLPFLMASTQFVTSKMMSSNITDPTQKQVMMLMPFMFIFILYQMPAGLMLYWTVQNIWQIGHTYLTKRYVAKHEAKYSETAVAKPAKA
ncbi:MAG: membrane protein insertase YidC [Sumerlaeia bacterium]